MCVCMFVMSFRLLLGSVLLFVVCCVMCFVLFCLFVSVVCVCLFLCLGVGCCGCCGCVDCLCWFVACLCVRVLLVLCCFS